MLNEATCAVYEMTAVVGVQCCVYIDWEAWQCRFTNMCTASCELLPRGVDRYSAWYQQLQVCTASPAGWSPVTW